MGTLTVIVLLLPAAFLLHWALYHSWLDRWGSTAAERSEPGPGGDWVPRPRLEYNQAVTIAAPPDSVWPWLVQMGDGRGGLYSYDWLENLVGCNMQSADRVIPELQDLKVGDMVKIMPAGGPTVAQMEPGRLLLLASFTDGDLKEYDRSGPRPERYIDQIWSFSLLPLPGGGTRLITRYRLDYGPNSALNWIIWQGFTRHTSVVMQRKMLLGIKQRAERWARQAAA